MRVRHVIAVSRFVSRYAATVCCCLRFLSDSSRLTKRVEHDVYHSDGDCVPGWNRKQDLPRKPRSTDVISSTSSPAEPSRNVPVLSGWGRAVFARMLLAYAVVLPIIVPLTATAISEPFTIAVTMQSRTAGSLQVFYDVGEGFSEPRSSAIPTLASDQSIEYRLSLPTGRFRTLRIDPGVSEGRYLIERVEVLAPDGSLHTSIPLEGLSTSNQLSVLERTAGRLVVEAPPGAEDPQLLFVPEAPLQVSGHESIRRLVAKIVLLWGCGVGIIWLVGWTLRRVGGLPASLLRFDDVFVRHPNAAIWVAALVATLISSYPIVFLGESLVTPNIGGIRLLYDDAPFTPGASDVLIEDPRGSDVSAAIVQDVPHSDVQRRALAAGEIPLWNRFNAGGRPLWGQGITFLLDPLHWLTLVTPDPSLGWDLKFLAHRFVFSLGLGLAALAATNALMPSFIVAASAPFVGLFAYRLNHPSIFVLTYAPWVLLAWFQLAVARDRRKRARIATMLALSSALVLVAGTPKEAAVTLLGLETTGALAVLMSPGPWRERYRRLRVAALAGIAALLITAPHWLTFFQSLRHSFTAYDSPYAIFAGNPQAIGFFLGPLTGGPLQPGLHLLALVLMIAALTAPQNVVKTPPLFACSIVSIGLISVAFGLIPAPMIVRVPLLGNIGHIHDAFIAAALPLLLVIAAFGADSLRTSSARNVTFVTLFVGAAIWCVYLGLRDVAGAGFQTGALLLVAPIAAAVPWCLYFLRAGSGGLLPSLAATAAMTILLLPGGLHATSGIQVLDHLLIQPRPRVRISQDSPVLDAIHRASTVPERTVGLEWTLFSGSQALYELEGIGGADPLEVPEYRELVDAAEIRRNWVWFTMVPASDLPKLAPLLDVLNVGVLLTRADQVPSGLVEIPVLGPDRLRAWRRVTAWPRAFFVDGASTYTDAQDLLRMVVAIRRPLAAVQASDDRAIAATRELIAPPGKSLPALSYKLTANTTSFVVRTSGPGLAVLTEAYLPDDFHASLNGARVPYFRVNHAFKGVVIPSRGEWDVRFEYRPFYWNCSLVLAGIGVAFLVGIIVWGRQGVSRLD
jgi:hypothetical protein